MADNASSFELDEFLFSSVTDNDLLLLLFTGRTGTIYGANKIDEYTSRTDAIHAFHALFLDKTGNQWLERNNFQKLPSKHYPLEIDYGQHADDDRMQKLLDTAQLHIQSKLDASIQDLIRMIFNVETMKQALLAFEIDLTKMPLGKLSKNQLDKAYKVLTEVQTLITNGTTASKTAMIDASNRFYTCECSPLVSGVTRNRERRSTMRCIPSDST